MYWVVNNNRPEYSFNTQAEAEKYIEKRKQEWATVGMAAPAYKITYNGKAVE